MFLLAIMVMGPGRSLHAAQPGAQPEGGDAAPSPASKAKGGKGKVGKAKGGKARFAEAKGGRPLPGKAKSGKAKAKARPRPENGGSARPGGVLGAAGAGSPIPMAANAEDGKIAVMVRRGKLRAAMPAVRERLELEPDNVDMHAALAILCAMAGDTSCALSASRFAVGSELFPREFIQVEANALRADGQGRAAAARRLELIWGADREGELAKHYALAARDLREAGAWGEAADALDRAEAVDPDSEHVHRERVLSAIDAGDLEAADWELWLRRRSGALWTAEDIEAELRFGLAADDRERLELAPRPRARDLLSNPALAASRARSLVVTDELGTAGSLLARASFQMWGEVYHPEILLADAAVYAAADAADDADARLRRAALLAPRHPDWHTFGQRPPK